MMLQLSDCARQALEQAPKGQLLRIAFAGGCGGLGFRVAWSATPADGDVVIDTQGLSIVLDSMAAHRLTGATIDFRAEDTGSEPWFVVDHDDFVAAPACG